MVFLIIPISTQPSLFTPQQLTKIFQYPLNFIVTRISPQRLAHCIAKKPAHTYTLIKTQKNQLNPNEDLLMINVDAYSHMEQFLRVKEQIEKDFAKDAVQFLGIPKVIKLENTENRRVAEELLARQEQVHHQGQKSKIQQPHCRGLIFPLHETHGFQNGRCAVMSKNCFKYIDNGWSDKCQICQIAKSKKSMIND